MQLRLSARVRSAGHFQKERGLEEKRVSGSPPIVRTSIDPWNDALGNRKRQSPQICCAFHCHASIRSEAGKSSVENSCDIPLPQGWRPLPSGRPCVPRSILMPCRSALVGRKRSTPALREQDQTCIKESRPRWIQPDQCLRLVSIHAAKELQKFRQKVARAITARIAAGSTFTPHPAFHPDSCFRTGFRPPGITRCNEEHAIAVREFRQPLRIAIAIERIPCYSRPMPLLAEAYVAGHGMKEDQSIRC